MDTNKLNTDVLTSIVRRFIVKAAARPLEVSDIIELGQKAFMAGAYAVVTEVNAAMDANKAGGK